MVPEDTGTTVPARILNRVPDELRTITGMAAHIAKLALQPTLRDTAARWFNALQVREQVALVNGAASTEHARTLVCLTPDAVTVLPYLRLELVRRVCDEQISLLEAVATNRYMDIVRATASEGGQALWLRYIYEAINADPERLEAFLDTISADELAAIFSGSVSEEDVDAFLDARKDPADLEWCFGDAFPFIRELAGLRHDLYIALLHAMDAQVCARYERRTRQRTQEEIERAFYGWRFYEEGDEGPDAAGDEEEDD